VRPGPIGVLSDGGEDEINLDLQKNTIARVRVSLAREAHHGPDEIQLLAGGRGDIKTQANVLGHVREVPKALHKNTNEVPEFAVGRFIIHLDEDALIR